MVGFVKEAQKTEIKEYSMICLVEVEVVKFEMCNLMGKWQDKCGSGMSYPC